MTTHSRIVEHQVGRDFGWLVIPASNPTIGIPAYSKACAHNFGSRIDRRQDVPEDYLHIPITVDLRMKFRLPDPITPPARVDGWHDFVQVSHAYFLRQRKTGTWAAHTVTEGDRVGYFVARPTWELANRNRIGLRVA